MAQARDGAQAAPALADLPPLPGAPPGSNSAAGRGRPRGHGETDAAAPDWQPTTERFRDPRSQRIMRVWVDAAGVRHYVPESA